jgi:predicted lipoprotein with Yx(FWY)xxD motif
MLRNFSRSMARRSGKSTTTARPVALLGAAIALAFGAQATAQQITPSTHQSDKGEVLADARGMTLYVFDRDQPGRSLCNGACATNWPPLSADPNAAAVARFSVIHRDDGSIQWAYRDRPLYTWTRDQKPGDTTGDGFLNGAWHVARP